MDAPLIVHCVEESRYTLPASAAFKSGMLLLFAEQPQVAEDRRVTAVAIGSEVMGVPFQVLIDDFALGRGDAGRWTMTLVAAAEEEETQEREFDLEFVLLEQFGRRLPSPVVFKWSGSTNELEFC